MDSLDLSTQQLILNDLALNLAADAGTGKLSQQDAAIFRSTASSSKVKGVTGRYLSGSVARNQIALALFASSISSASHSTEHTTDATNDAHLAPVLAEIVDLVENLTTVVFEEGMGWSEWPLPDELAFALVSSLLQIATRAPQHRTRCVDAIVHFAEHVTVGLGSTTGDAHILATRLVPLFHGLYRALSSVPFAWTIVEFAHLATAVSPLVGPAQTIRRLNDALLVLPEQQGARAQGGRATRRKPKKPTIRPKDEEDDNHSEGSVDTFFSGGEDADEEDEQDRDLQGGFTYVNGKDDVAEDSYQYRQALLKHYRRVGRPLSGHFVLCGGLELLSAVLAQVLAVRAKPPIQDFSDYQKAKLDLDQIDPSRRADGDALDIPGVDTVSSHPGHHHSLPEQPSLATTRAWSALLRTAVSNFPKDKAEEQIQTNGQDAPNQTAGSRILNALPIIGINNGSAAFGQDEGPQGVKTSDDVAEAIASILHASSRAYHDLQRFVSTEGQKQSELFVDVYALEILSEALKLSALCSVAQARIVGSPMDSHVLVRVRNLLSEQAPVYEPLVQGAALQSVGVLVHNFPAIALPMSQQLRRFVTSPLAMFEPEPKGGATISPVLASAAKCLATCVKVAPGDDLVVSTMYSLLNYLGKDAATGGLSAGGAAGSGVSVRSGASRALTGRDHATGVTHSNSSGHFATRSEEQKRLINTSTISMVSRLALEVRSPDVTALTVSMLLQRLRTADPLAEAAILSNLVPLALAAPKALYVDVVRALTQVSRNALTGGASRRGTAAVQAAQLKLARSLGRLNERDDTDRVQPAQKGQEVDETEGGRKEIFLVELLQLFADKGMQLQTLASSEHSSREETAELNTDLAALIPVIDALLSHNDINPQLEPTTEIVVLFRNMWFLAVLFGYASSQAAHASAAGTDAKQTPQQAQAALVTAALRRIALKTPALVPETAHNYLESDLEYNSVLKREFSHATLDSQRKALAAVIPSHAGEVRSFSYAQVTFLMTTYELECMRSSMGRPSMILWYFVNDGLNTSSLIGCMEAIAQKVIASFIEDLSHQVNDHALDPRVSAEVKNLMLGSCHRFAKVRAVSRTFLDKLIGSFPSLLCDPDLVVTMLEMLTLLRRGCEGEYNDEYSPVYHFHSERANISFDLSDSYVQREEILTQFLERVRSYLSLLMGRAPVELQGILQRYLGTFDDASLPGTAELGKSVAVDFARLMPASARTDSYLPKLGGWRADASSSFVGELSSKSTYLGEMTGIHLALTRGLLELQKDPSSDISEDAVAQCKRQLAHLSSELVSKKATIPFAELRRLLYRGAALIVALPEPDFDLLHHIVAIPIRVFAPAAITSASHVWTWVIGERPEVETKIMVEISIGWLSTVKTRRGLFSPLLSAKHPFLQKTEMSAFDRSEITREHELARKLFSPHLTLIHLISSRYQAFRYRDPTMVLALVRLIQRSGAATSWMSTHPLAREARFSLIVFGFRVIQGSRLDALVEFQLREALFKMAFAWFASYPQWSHGSNRLQIRAEMQLMTELLETLRADRMRADYVVSSFPPSVPGVRLPGSLAVQDSVRIFGERRALLQLLVENELGRFSVWNNPLSDTARGQDYVSEMAKAMNETAWPGTVQIAWKADPRVAVQMPHRFKSPAVAAEVGRLVRAQPFKVVGESDAMEHLLADHLKLANKDGTDLRWLLFWAAVTPVEAIHLFQPQYGNHPMVLQYAMRALEQHPVELTFFYVPQVVQALRDDAYGYVEQFIFETSKISQLFCHQIIWNMKANSYKDDNAEVEDPMKPTLDRMVELIVQALSGEAKDFYEREFGFFNEVTSISGKLKPFIKKSKPEKKAKIDEEMAKIKVDPGVYLPSNPDGVVVDLDRKSGRPLQSHAKAPFMATFKVHRDIVRSDADEASEDSAVDLTGGKRTGVDVWQAAIFKVGDDCRQDVLALQVIAMFKNIFTTSGLDLYLNPYRVTATGPGCGVIDVVPNATSRDEMGRAKVNNLFTFFIAKYGNVDGIAFQKARLNFIQSMAAYSLACYILQIKDRHNGNIMIDGDGHIIHIDFGFLFDIGPGGVKFEPNSFKLNHEMIEVMGGQDSQGFRMFCELLTKAFLASRPYAEQIVDTVHLMLGTDLPSFKGEPTIDRLRDRFKLGLNERQAAKYMQTIIKDAYENPRSTFYDGFQKLQNGIPY